MNDREDDRDVPALQDEHEEVVSGRNWAVILIFVVVPLAALVGLVMSLHTLFVLIFGTAQAPQTVIESTVQPS